MSRIFNSIATSKHSVVALFSLSVPVAMGYVPLGTVYGFLFVQSGVAWWIPPLASLLVFAGAAQFMAVSLLAAGASASEIVAATFVINLRHIFYGLSLLHKFPSGIWARFYLIWSLTDENYSILTTLPPFATSAQMAWVAMLNHFWWVLGTLIGSAIGAQATHAFTGIDFSLAALFAVLTVEQWRATGRTAPIFIAVVSYAIAWWLLPSQALLVSIGMSLVAGVVLKRYQSTEI